MDSFKRKWRRYLKWSIAVWIILVAVVLYFNLMDVVKMILITPFQDFLNSKGYPFGITSLFDWVTKLLPPAVLLPSFVIRGGSMKVVIEEIIFTATWIQLISLALLLPFVVFVQAKVINQIKPAYVSVK